MASPSLIDRSGAPPDAREAGRVRRWCQSPSLGHRVRPVVTVFALAVLLARACAAYAGPAGPWTRIRCPEADRSADERFEQVRPVTGFEDGVGAWRALQGGQQAQSVLETVSDERHAGRASLRVDYSFGGEKRLEYVEIGAGVKLEEPGLGVGFWVKGDGTKLGLRIRVVDASGETHQPNVARMGATVWQYVAVAFDTRGGRWGGDGNGRLDYPCTLHSIVGDRPERGYKGSGSLWIDDVRLVRARKSEDKLLLEAGNSRFGNLYEPGEAVELRTSGPGEAIRWRVEDFWGREVADGKGPVSGTDIRFIPPGEGFFACTVERVAGERVAESRVFRCGILGEPDVARRNEFVGLCSHFRSSAYPLACMDLMQRLGVTEFRDEVSWSAFEAERGVMAMPGYGAAFTDKAAAMGMRPLLIFDYANQHYDDGGFPNSDEAVNAYAKYCATLAGELTGKVGAFEVWNEWSGGCGMSGKPGEHTPEAYARILAAAHREVKKATPGVTLVGIGGEHSAHHFDNIKGMIQGGAAGAMDCLSVHSYRYPRSPEETDLVGEIRKVAAMAESLGAPPRIWVTEIGWPTHTGPRGVGERTQARYIVRTMALLAATGVVEKVHWYDLKNDGLTRSYNEHNFGVVWHQRFNCAPKPAALALSVFARATAGAEPQRLWEQAGCLAAFLKRPDGTRLAVAWKPDGQAWASASGSGLEVTDIMGNRLPDAAPLRLGPDPVYLAGRQLTLSVRPQ